MLTNRMMKALSLCLVFAALAVFLSACSAAPRRGDSYTSGSGVVTPLDNDRESCTRSCNADYDRCSDTKAAQREVGRAGQMTGVFGGAADCKDDLRSCLNSCRAR